MDFELCIDSGEEALITKQFGFKRVELCSGLEVGGLTPSYGLISSCTVFLFLNLLSRAVETSLSKS